MGYFCKRLKSVSENMLWGVIYSRTERAEAEKPMIGTKSLVCRFPEFREKGECFGEATPDEEVQKSSSSLPSGS